MNKITIEPLDEILYVLLDLLTVKESYLRDVL